jgi:hypothetical protein
MAGQAASATASLHKVLKAGPLCRQRILNLKKIPVRGTSVILYQDIRDPCTGEDQRFSSEGLHLVSISVHLLRFSIAWGRFLFIGLVLCAMVLRLLLLSWRVLSSWALRNNYLYLEGSLFW